ncbi:MAG: type II secretion system protein [Kiritimatiellia bacterium]
MKTHNSKPGFTLIEMLACQPKPWRRQRRSGFTLIEMLVVIAIIALLAGLLFPAITAALQTAYRRKATVTCQSIESAIVMYMNDNNGRFPIPSDAYAPSDNTIGGGNEKFSQDILRVLMALNGGFSENNNYGLNRKRKVYLSTEIPSEDGTYRDPWKTQYQIILDLNMDGKITYPPGSSDAHRKKAVVVSAGKATGNNDDPEFNDGNDLANVDLPNQ